MKREVNDEMKIYENTENLCDETFYDNNDKTLQNPNKIGDILLKYISNDLKNVTWEKEGNEVIFHLMSILVFIEIFCILILKK